MKITEIKETKEVVVRTEYVAIDGTVFNNEEACRKYESSALAVAKSKLKPLAMTSTYGILEEGCDEDGVEIYDIQTEEDLDNLKRYLFLVISENASQKYVDACFNEQFDKPTIGHEVICNFYYDRDYVWFCGDGSARAYADSIYNRIMKMITPKEER